MGNVDLCEQVLNTLNDNENTYLLNATVQNSNYHNKKLSGDNVHVNKDFKNEIIIPSELDVQLSLAFAAHSGKPELLKMLIRHGADPKQVDNCDDQNRWCLPIPAEEVWGV